MFIPVNKEKILNISMFAGAAVSIALAGFQSFASDCERLPDEVFRMHIIANSDSEEDQSLKYKLRDFLLSEVGAELTDCANSTEARDKAEALIPEIERRALSFVNEQGFVYDVKAEVADMYFTTRVYENVTLPAGNYCALRVTIGEGAGQNWWCVMFPPLCLPACSDSEAPYFSDEASRRIENGGKTEVKFAVYEFFAKWFKR